MKTSAQIADGFPHKERIRAHLVRRRAFSEGMQAAALMVEQMLTANVDDSDILQAISIWVKETREMAGDDG